MSPKLHKLHILMVKIVIFSQLTYICTVSYLYLVLRFLGWLWLPL